MLKIKKQVKDPETGLITEIEGSEAEVEAFLKKHEKMRQQESPKRKRDLILGKGMSEADLRRIIREEIAAAPKAAQVIHWHHNNGWWWAPYWNPTIGGVSYYYTSSDPNVDPVKITYASTNNADEVASKVGLTSNWVSSVSNTVTSQGLQGNYLVSDGSANGFNTFSAAIPLNASWSGSVGVGG